MENNTSYQNWVEDYQQKQNEIIRQKRIYYDQDEHLMLPHHTRYYYDWLSSRYNSLTMEHKLRDLGFLVTMGFDLQQSIREYKVDRDEYITEAIPQTFIQYIIYMRFREYLHFIDDTLREMPEEEIIALFIDEIKLRYDASEHTVRIGDWNDDKLSAACTHKEIYERYVTTTEWTKNLLKT